MVEYDTVRPRLFSSKSLLISQQQGQSAGTPRMPTAFQLLTLVAFRVFLTLKVDATILEVGAGGTTDVTNIVPKPVVAAVTALGVEHASFLGNTLKDIALHKSGIFKVSTTLQD